jgi:DNA-binding protein HU-beta
VERKEKKGRNQRTGEEMTIEATSSVKFKPGKDLKNSIVNKA